MKIKSTAFKDGEFVPLKHTCDGQDISPELSWSGIPGNTVSLALIMDDPDAPVRTFSHWVIFNIPPENSGLTEAVPVSPELPDGTRQGINDFGRFGYGGPCPPPGKPHHYNFNLYALDKKIELPAGTTRNKLLDAMKGHIIYQAKLTGIYKR